MFSIVFWWHWIVRAMKLKHWQKISLLLCVFGFFKDFRPSEHYIYEFLIGPWRDLTPEEISQKVYPVATYSYLAQLAIVFLITDLLRYKPLIIVLGFSGIIIWSMLLWTTSLLELQILEVCIFFSTLWFDCRLQNIVLCTD